MAENGNDSPIAKIITILLLISLMLFGYYVIYRGAGNTGVVRIVPAEQPVVNRSLQEEEREGERLAEGEVRGAEVGESCAQRPGTYGMCGFFLGVYSTGSECVRVYGCDLNGDRPPYFSLPECSVACDGGSIERSGTP